VALQGQNFLTDNGGIVVNDIISVCRELRRVVAVTSDEIVFSPRCVESYDYSQPWVDTVTQGANLGSRVVRFDSSEEFTRILDNSPPGPAATEFRVDTWALNPTNVAPGGNGNSFIEVGSAFEDDRFILFHNAAETTSVYNNIVGSSLVSERAYATWLRDSIRMESDRWTRWVANATMRATQYPYLFCPDVNSGKSAYAPGVVSVTYTDPSPGFGPINANFMPISGNIWSHMTIICIGAGGGGGSGVVFSPGGVISVSSGGGGGSGAYDVLEAEIFPDTDDVYVFIPGRRGEGGAVGGAGSPGTAGSPSWVIRRRVGQPDETILETGGGQGGNPGVFGAGGVGGAGGSATTTHGLDGFNGTDGAYTAAPAVLAGGPGGVSRYPHTPKEAGYGGAGGDATLIGGGGFALSGLPGEEGNIYVWLTPRQRDSS
jgi:hypothetical protein